VLVSGTSGPRFLRTESIFTISIHEPHMMEKNITVYFLDEKHDDEI
jgi:hypothetical protein